MEFWSRPLLLLAVRCTQAASVPVQPSALAVAQSAVSAGDWDGDGALSFDEWRRQIASNSAFAKASFELADADGDGLLDAEPWHEAERRQNLDVVQDPWILSVMKKLKEWGTDRSEAEIVSHLDSAPGITKLSASATKSLASAIFNYAHAAKRDPKLASGQMLAQLIDGEADQEFWEELAEALPGVSEQAASDRLRDLLASKPRTLPSFD